MDDAAQLAKSLQSILDRSKADSTMGMIAELLETLTMAIEQMSEANNKVQTASGDSLEKISVAFDKLAVVLKERQKVNIELDLSPLTRSNEIIARVSNEISGQNKSIMEAMQELAKSDKTSPLVDKVLNLIERSNEFIKSGMKAVDYSIQINEIATAIRDKPREWDFEISYSSGRMSKVTATAKK